MGTVAGGVAFIVTGIPLLGTPSWGPLTLTTALAAVWLAGEYVVRATGARATGGRLQVIAITGLMVLPPILWPHFIGTAFVLTGVDAFAACLTAVVRLGLRSAVVAILVIVAVDAWMTYLWTYVPGMQHLVLTDTSVPVLGPWAGVIATGVTAVGLAVWVDSWTRASKRSDAQFVAARELLGQELRAEAALEGRAEALRHAHATVLNTLIALSYGVKDRFADDARVMCVEQLQAVAVLATPRRMDSVADCVTSALEATRIPVPVHTHFQDDAPRPVDPFSGLILRDCITEALVNSARHADASEVAIDVSTEGDDVVVMVRDNGVGVTDQAVPGYGTSTVLPGIRHLGGSFELRSSPHGGTDVVIRIPVAHARAGVSDVSPHEASLVGRLAAVSPLAWALVTLPFLAHSLAQSAYLVSAVVLSCLLIGANAVLWLSRWKSMTAVLALIAVSACFATSAVPSVIGPDPLDPCLGTSLANYLIVGVVGGCVLVLLSLRRHIAWLAALPVAAGVVAFAAMDTVCSIDPLVNLVSTYAYLVFAAVATSVIFRRLEQQRERTTQALTDAALVEADSQRMTSALETWSRLPSSATDLLWRIGSGQIAPSGTWTKARASVEVLRVRAYLEAMTDSHRPYDTSGTDDGAATRGLPV